MNEYLIWWPNLIVFTFFQYFWIIETWFQNFGSVLLTFAIIIIKHVEISHKGAKRFLNSNMPKFYKTAICSDCVVCPLQECRSNPGQSLP